MAERKDSVALRSGNRIRIRQRDARVGAKRCQFISYAVLQPPRAAEPAKSASKPGSKPGPKPARRRKRRAA